MKTVTDHLGNTFKSECAMCRFHNINRDVYRRRVNLGLPIEQCLSKKSTNTFTNTTTCYDHLGNMFISKKDMAKYYDISVASLNERLSKGMSLEKALTKPKLKDTHTIHDHLGNKFTSISAMAEFYNIPVKVYEHRIKRGWSIEKALLTPIKKLHQIKAPNGKTYDSRKSMCDDYNVNESTFYKYLKKGKTIEEALQATIVDKTKTDPFGNVFASQKEMSDFYNIPSSKISNRLVDGYSLIEALGIIPLLKVGIKEVSITNDFVILEALDGTRKEKPEYFLCEYNNHDTVCTRQQILDYALEHLSINLKTN